VVLQPLRNLSSFLTAFRPEDSRPTCVHARVVLQPTDDRTCVHARVVLQPPRVLYEQRSVAGQKPPDSRPGAHALVVLRPLIGLSSSSFLRSLYNPRESHGLQAVRTRPSWS